MQIRSFIKIPLFLFENIFFSVFPSLRPIIEKHIFNPYHFNEAHKEYSENQFGIFVKKIGGVNNIIDKNVLEIGPGGSIGFGLLALKNGAQKYYAVENGRHSFITNDRLDSYKKILNNDEKLIENLFLKERKGYIYNPLRINFIEINQDSKYSIPDNSIDFIYSCAVLEHVHNLDLCFSEMHRVLKINGIMNHQVDLQDHIFSQESLQFLKINDFWFNKLFKNIGAYVNRKRWGEYENLIKKNGLKILNLEKNVIFLQNDRVPKKLSDKYSIDDLQTVSFNVTCQKN